MEVSPHLNAYRDGILGHQFRTKDESLLLHDIHSAFYWRILKKTVLYSGFNNPYKKYAKQQNSSLFMNSIL